MQNEFVGRTAIVTGGASGIGRACSIALGRRGANVVVSDVDERGGGETVEQIRSKGGQAEFVRADVSSSTDVEALTSFAAERFGGIDVAVNNAGIEGQLAPVAEYPDEAWERVLAVNLSGVWRCMKHEIPHLLRAGGGSIVNMASILGLVGFANASAYTAAKHGVLGLTKAAALELAPSGVRVNAVCPGFIETPMVMERGVKAGEDPAVRDEIADLHPVGRLGTSEEVAEAVVWLCSDASSFVTGEALTVDGGYVAR